MSALAVSLPLPGRVFQRGRNGRATIPLEDGIARARVLSGKKTVCGWAPSPGGVEGVPTGGPYTLETETTGGQRHQVKDLYVGDLWLLAGQSNMDGYGKLIDLEPASRHVRCFYYNETWDTARDPLCVLVDSIDPVHWPCEENGLQAARDEDHRFREHGAGLGVRFGKDIYKAQGVPVGLVMCSHGGTSIEQWDPALKEQGGRSLYGSMLRRVGACGGKVKGVLWYQGESNANREAAGTYKERMRGLIEAVRNDLGANLPFIQVQLSRLFADETQFSAEHWNRVQQVQLELADEMKNTATVAAIDATLSDAIHLDAKSERKLGARLAEAALVLAYGAKRPLPLIPGKAAVSNKRRDQVSVPYRNVRGRLRPGAGVLGFWVEDAGGRVAVKRAEAAGTAVTLELERALGPEAKLWYGRGLNPATNLRDDVFAAPVFGPVAL